MDAIDSYSDLVMIYLTKTLLHHCLDCLYECLNVLYSRYLTKRNKMCISK